MNAYKLSEIEVGLTACFERKITVELENQFREISGDQNPLHSNDVFAREISGEKFQSHVTFGMLTASLYSTMAGMYLPGKYSLIHSFEQLSFLQPVFAGDTLTVSGEVTDKDDTLRLIRLKVIIRNQNGTAVSKAKIKILVMQ